MSIAGGAAIAALLALTGCNALFGRDVRLADDGGGGSDDGGGVIIEPTGPECAAPLAPCSLAARPVVGDWDGNRTDRPGLFDAGRWCLTNRRAAVGVCLEDHWGAAGDTPIVGDWFGDRVSRPGTYNLSQWDLKDARGAGQPAAFAWGNQLIAVIAGDWTRLGHDTPGGIHDLTTTVMWALSNHNSSGGTDLQFTWGVGDAIYLVGDWDGTGTDTPAWYRNGVWTFSNVNSIGGTAASFRWGTGGDVPVAGDWDGDGFDTVGLYRDGEWLLSDEHVSALQGTTDGVHATGFRWGTE